MSGDPLVVDVEVGVVASEHRPRTQAGKLRVLDHLSERGRQLFVSGYCQGRDLRRQGLHREERVRRDQFGRVLDLGARVLVLP